MIHEEITSVIINCAYKVHNTLGSGFLEKVYEKAMIIELEKANFDVKSQFPLPVFYEGKQIGDYYADLFVNELIIIELKAVENIVPTHEAQLVNYLAATKIEIGLLINFGESVQIKRKFRTYRKTQNPEKS